MREMVNREKEEVLALEEDKYNQKLLYLCKNFKASLYCLANNQIKLFYNEKNYRLSQSIWR